MQLDFAYRQPLFAAWINALEEEGVAPFLFGGSGLNCVTRWYRTAGDVQGEFVAMAAGALSSEVQS
jgi:hypothetical protein